MKTNIKIINVPTLLEYAQLNSYDNKIRYTSSVKNKIENEKLLRSSDAEALEKVFNLFHKELFDNRDLTADENYQTWYITDEIIKEVKNNVFEAHFWEYLVYTNRLKAEIQKIILSNEFIEMPNIISKRVFLINEITEIAHNKYCK
jgi:type I restriction enzyme R subunit